MFNSLGLGLTRRKRNKLVTILLGSTRNYSILGFEPKLVFDFKSDTYTTNKAVTTFSSAMVHERASSATMVNSSGAIVTVGINVPRLGHHIYNGTSWVNEGLLHESEARANLLLNSNTLSTQDVTTSAVATTLSFTGTGTVTLSGTATGALSGTGTGENNRVVLTFSPTAGPLTLTVSGTVTNAQLEAGLTASSYIPTGGTSQERKGETITVPVANLPYDADNMSIQLNGRMTYSDSVTASNLMRPIRWQASSGNTIRTRFLVDDTFDTGSFTFQQRASGANSQVGTDANYLSAGVAVRFNISSRHGSSFINGATDGTALSQDVSPTVLPDLTTTDLQLGEIFMGTLGQFRMWDEDITDAGIAAAST